MATPPPRTPEPPAPLPDTAYDVDPPTPAESRRYRVVLQVWVIFFLVILVSGLLNYLWGFFVRG